MRHFNTILKQKAKLFRIVNFIFLHGTSPCGSSSKDAQDLQCVTLNRCKKDVGSQLKTQKIGPYEEIQDEIVLLLDRAGKVFHLSETESIKEHFISFF